MQKIRVAFWLQFPAALAAFVGFGAWAYWLNRTHPLVIKFALVQGSYAFASTLLMRLLALAIFRQLSSFATKSRFACAWLLSAGSGLLLPWILQTLVGNPKTLLSIAPGASVGAMYCALLLWNQTRGTLRK
jgi:hypothetical protein